MQISGFKEAVYCNNNSRFNHNIHSKPLINYQSQDEFISFKAQRKPYFLVVLGLFTMLASTVGLSSKVLSKENQSQDVPLKPGIKVGEELSPKNTKNQESKEKQEVQKIQKSQEIQIPENQSKTQTEPARTQTAVTPDDPSLFSMEEWNKLKGAPSPEFLLFGKKRLARIVISRKNFTTYLYYDDGKCRAAFQNAVGKLEYNKSTKKMESLTPTGIFQIYAKDYNPFKKHGGPLMLSSPWKYGKAAIFIKEIMQDGKEKYHNKFLHGTDEPDSIGKNESGGCIRHGEKEIITLAESVKIGEYVLINDWVPPENK